MTIGFIQLYHTFNPCFFGLNIIEINKAGSEKVLVTTTCEMMVLGEKKKDQNSAPPNQSNQITQETQFSKLVLIYVKIMIIKLENKLQLFTSRPDISRSASAHRDVESAIMLTLYPISLKYSAKVIPAHINALLWWISIQQIYLNQAQQNLKEIKC